MSAPAGAGDDLEAERLARAELSRVFEPGDTRCTGLVAEIGGVAMHTALSNERDLAGVRTDYGARLTATDGAVELERAERLGLRFVIPGDPEWPSGLDDLAGVAAVQERGGPPLGLWVRGPLRLDEVSGAVAVVGARTSTSYGNAVAADLAATVAEAGRVVVSGAAYGIDYRAHTGALAADGRTVAVLACGADRVYPQGHDRLLAHLAAEGAIVSEAPPGCAPQRIRFLARNRLIAALTAGTVVVEAAIRSGALNTANWAGRLLRPVLGVPGPVTSAASAGVHQLLRDGGATLVTGGTDVLEVLGAAGEHLVEVPRAPDRPRDRLTTRQRQVLDGVPVGQGARADSVARAAGLGVVEVQGTLRRLEEIGHVERDASGWRLGPLAMD
ncbi:DNA-processing protein DprA [Nocardioides sp. CFH 31398]|uniref:DNA-processing protein DprA n=1 Tax=Nocardioides sp. CFH 31398 TaxID=2919579 RepID=UPI001F05A9F3|nr:DNA-processing protein DprA [Nocardioides sp. CFH 31398]MCH1868678.1 DNA-processing protein DprA [Nocardioides sp. CFH 31398]